MGKHSKKKKKREPIDTRDLTIQFLSSLSVGILLLLIEKYLL